MNDIIDTPEKITLKDRVKARILTTKQFVGRHKTALAIGAFATPAALYLARKSGQTDQLQQDQETLDAYFEGVDTETEEMPVSTTE